MCRHSEKNMMLNKLLNQGENTVIPPLILISLSMRDLYTDRLGLATVTAKHCDLSLYTLLKRNIFFQFVVVS